MSIKSTQEVTREWAIHRIIMIYIFINNNDYEGLEDKSFENNIDLQSFVDDFIRFDIYNIKQWTNKMLEDQLDEPFFRESIFDNYVIKLQ